MERTRLDNEDFEKISFKLGFKIISYKKEIRGVNDTKYIITFEKNNKQFQGMLTIYEPPEVSAGGRIIEDAIKSINYNLHLYKKNNIDGVLDIKGKRVECFVPRPFLFKTGSIKLPYYILHKNNSKRVIGITEIVLDKNDKLQNIADAEERINKHLCFKVGRGLASIQLAGKDFSDKIDNKFPIECFSDMLRQIEININKISNINIIDPQENNPSEILEWIKKEVTSILNHYKKIKNEFEFGICHLDCHPVNTIDGKEGIYFIDFGTVGYDSYIYDMTMGLDTFTCRNNKPIKELVSSFIKGYSSVRKLPEIEKKNMLFFIKAGLIKWAMYRVLKCFDSFKSSNQYIARTNLERYKNWEKFFLNDNVI